MSTSEFLSKRATIQPSGRRRQCAERRSPRIAGKVAAAACALLLPLLAGCGPGQGDAVTQAEQAFDKILGTPDSPTIVGGVSSRYLGSIAADDATAVGLARRVLIQGGTAADAATELALALTVTQPGRAGLDGGGLCLIKPAGIQPVEELDFLPQPVEGSAIPVPGLVRGLAALEDRYGKLRWQNLVAPVESLATTGITVTPGLLTDLREAGLGDASPSGKALAVGDVVPQRAVAATLAQLRIGGPEEFYTGPQGGVLVGAGIPGKELVGYTAVWRGAPSLSAGGDRLYYPAGPSGDVVAAAWTAAAQAGDPAARFAAARAAGYTEAAASLLDQPAGSTGFFATDASGLAVSCAIGMGRPFGTGQIIESLAIFASNSFTGRGITSLAPLLGVNGAGDQVLATAVGAGSAAAPADAAVVAASVLLGSRGVALAVSDPRVPAEAVGQLVPDRVSMLACPGGLPGQPNSCSIQNDPRGGGYAMAVDQLVRAP